MRNAAPKLDFLQSETETIERQILTSARTEALGGHSASFILGFSPLLLLIFNEKRRPSGRVAATWAVSARLSIFQRDSFDSTTKPLERAHLRSNRITWPCYRLAPGRTEWYRVWPSLIARDKKVSSDSLGNEKKQQGRVFLFDFCFHGGQRPRNLLVHPLSYPHCEICASFCRVSHGKVTGVRFGDAGRAMEINDAFIGSK